MMETLSNWAAWTPQLLRGYWLSLQVASLAIAIGLVFGLMLALGVTARARWLKWPCLAVVELGRGAPALILLQFAYYGLPSAGLTLSSYLSAVAGLALCTAAYTSEIIRGGIESVPRGQKEAAIATGLSKWDTLVHVVLPQGLAVSIPPLLGFSITILQATSLCFAIALPEMVSQAYSIGSATFRYLSVLTYSGVLFALVCIPASILVHRLELRLSRHAR